MWSNQQNISFHLVSRRLKKNLIWVILRGIQQNENGWKTTQVIAHLQLSALTTLPLTTLPTTSQPQQKEPGAVSQSHIQV
jgi:hypothetical protein